MITWRTRTKMLDCVIYQTTINARVLWALSISLLACACTNRGSTVMPSRPTNDISGNFSAQPESQQLSYLKIIGDLRWDKYRTIADWKRGFPRCRFDAAHSFDGLIGDANGPRYRPFETGWGSHTEQERQEIRSKCAINFANAGLFFRIIDLRDTDIGESPVTTGLLLGMTPSRRSSLQSALKAKYGESYLGGNPIYCSRYSCFKFYGDNLYIKPTNTTLQILDRPLIVPEDL